LAAAKLTDKQKRFCEEYLIDLNATQAAIRSGYSEKTAQEQSARMLSKVIIQTEIKRLQDIRSERTELTQDYVINGFRTVFERCIQAEPVMIKVNGKLEESGEYKFDASGANTALTQLGRHLNIFADDNKGKSGDLIMNFTEQVIVKLHEIEKAERLKTLNGSKNRIKDLIEN